MTSLEIISYNGWKNVAHLTNGAIDLKVTLDIGPRIIHCGFSGGVNMFKEFKSQAGATGGNEFRSYGGHRLWQAPEDLKTTYFPDNRPVQMVEIPKGIRVTAPVEEVTQIQKELDITLSSSKAAAKVVNRITNAGSAPIELAPWALTVMDNNGVAVMPLPPFAEHDGHLLPVTNLALWSFTNLSDERWSFGKQTILLRQDPRLKDSLKIGQANEAGWLAYALAGQLFVKYAAYTPGSQYPDKGSSHEIYTDDQILELETLGPLTLLRPGASVELVEDWRLFDNVPIPANEADVLTHILPLV